jgi:DNA-binding NarL/FixJ family response regulator
VEAGQIEPLAGRIEVVAEAANADDGAAAVRRTRPDVLLLDVRMPGKSGIELLQELRATGDASRNRDCISDAETPRLFRTLPALCKTPVATSAMPASRRLSIRARHPAPSATCSTDR